MYSDQLAFQGFPLTSKYFVGVCGLARKLAFKYGKESLSEDFIQIALATACRMEPKYTKEQGASFYTFINKPIKNAIQITFGNQNKHTVKYKLIHNFINEYDKTHGMYPDVQTISLGTKLSRFDILSIYYDKFSTSSLDDVKDFSTASDPFANTDHSWIMEHLDILDESERYLIHSLYTYELNLKDAAEALGTSIKEAKALQESALGKLRQSVLDYQ